MKSIMPAIFLPQARRSITGAEAVCCYAGVRACSRPRVHRGALTLRRAVEASRRSFNDFFVRRALPGGRALRRTSFARIRQSPMSRLRILPVSLAALCITLGKAHAQYAYVKHSEVLVQRGATTAVLPENRLRAFVYCVVTSPGKSEPLAPSVVTMGDATTGVAVHYPDRPPQPWGNTGAVWVFSDQIAMISCVEFAIPQYRTPHRETNPTG